MILRIPIDDVIVTADKVLDRLYETAENTLITDNDLYRVTALARADIERIIEKFGEKCMTCAGAMHEKGGDPPQT